MASSGPIHFVSSEKLASLFAACVCTILYILFSFPFPDWLDSPELITASEHLGIFHPPGSPLAVLLGHGLSVWPFAQPGKGMLFFSAIWAGLSVYVISRINQLMWQNFASASGRKGTMIAAPGMAVATGLTPGLLSQAVRTEVYTLALFLALLVVFQGVKILTTDSTMKLYRPLDQASLFTGMGFAVHPLVALVPLPMILLSLLGKQIRRRVLTPGAITRSCLLFLLGAAPLAFVGLMAHGWSDLRWGDPTSIDGWFKFISGTTFSPAFSSGPEDITANLYSVFLLLVAATGWPLLVAAFVGIYALARTRLSLALGFALIILSAGLPLLLQRSFRLDNPDATGYVILAIVTMGFFANITFVFLANVLQGRCNHCHMISAIITLALVTHAVIFEAPGHDRSGCRFSERLVVNTVKALPKNSIMLLADFNLVFMMDYIKHVRRLRPDITTVYLRDLQNPSLRSKLAELHPDLEKLLPADSNLTVDGIVKLANAFPLSMDMGPHFPTSSSLLPIKPVGLVWTIRAHEKIRGEDMAKAQATIFEDIDLNCTGSIDARAADVVAWHAYFQAINAQRLALFDLARYMVGVAKKASPKDEKISRVFRLINR